MADSVSTCAPEALEGYHCILVGGPDSFNDGEARRPLDVRFAEFFSYRDGIIDTLTLHHDGQASIAKGSR